MMRYKLAIFDLDGTILDTLEDLKNSVNFALNKNNLPERSLCEIRSFVGNGIRLLVERAVPENTSAQITEKVFSDFKTHYKSHSADNTKPYEGIKELLISLKEKGVKSAVVSNKADFAVQTLVDDYFSGFFDFAVGEKDGVRRKPHPDSVFTVLEKLNVNKEDAIYIGDSEVDVETARNTGMSCVAVTWGFRDESLLKKLNPEYIVSSPSEIINIVLGE